MKYACVHGHFYQPPRENPWLEEVELQDSAHPHHDWNERITEECYAPNTASRLLDGEGRVADIVSNYSRMSFNFGPTLLSWLERRRPGAYNAILEADRLGRERFSGHGPAIAQCYNHLIMPLANARDKRTQVVWGLKDFERRFGRRPEGIWLPETAADLATLEALAAEGVKFTLLAPGQAKRVRRTGDKDWHDVSGGKVDPRRPYLCRLPGGGEITLFFYDGPLSREIAFNGMLNDGNVFMGRLGGALDAEPKEPQLSHIATDGETYGHHHRHGDMALAYCLSNIEKNAGLKLTVYGEFLEKHPPRWEAEIWDNSSWSCAHGVERWRSDCGCNSGRQGWHQKWRAPLRSALDWLRDNLASLYEEKAAELLREPWAARDAYIGVLLDRSEGSLSAFFAAHAAKELSPDERLMAMRLLEMQRNAMLMYTSCGWFFDEVSGIETVQIMGYAARAAQLGRQAAGVDLEPGFLDLLARAPGNIPEFSDGRRVYELFVKPAELDLLRVGVHYGASSIFERDPGDADIYCYGVKRRELEVLESGQQRLAVGRVRISSRITTEADEISFVMLYLGGYNLLGAAREFMGAEAFGSMRNDMKAAFSAGSLADMTRVIDQNFPKGSYSLWHLFRDEQRKVIDQIFSGARAEISAAFRQIYSHHAAILDVTSRLRVPLPRGFAAAAEAVLNEDICAALASDPPDAAAIGKAAEVINRFSLSVDRAALGLSVAERLNSFADVFAAGPSSAAALEKMAALLEAVTPLGLEMSLWRVQNIMFKSGLPAAPEKRKAAEGGDAAARRWLDLFGKNSGCLKVKFDY